MTDLALPPDEFETWVNAVQGIVVIKKFGETGRLIDVVVPGGRRFDITPKERRINSEKAYTTDLDAFKNGVLQPVSLIETERDVAAIRDNPNVLSDGEMRALFGTHWKTFEKKIGEITSPLLVKRLVSIANEPETNASVRELDILRGRIDVLEPKSKDVQEIENLG